MENLINSLGIPFSSKPKALLGLWGRKRTGWGFPRELSMGTTRPDGPCGPPAPTLCAAGALVGEALPESRSLGGLSGGLAKKPGLV